MVKIFLTGATGYVGGEVLYQIANHDNLNDEITCLVRGDDKIAIMQKAFPQVRVVKGDLDDLKTIEEESKTADIVLHIASAQHNASASAIAKGLNDPSRTSPGHWIQMSGASLFVMPEVIDKKFGQASNKTYDDIKDVKEILSIISQSSHRVVDNLVVSQEASKVKTALVIGPLIYGQARGPVNQRSIQAPEIARNILKDGKGFQLGSGLNIWSNIHIRDLGSLIVTLVESAKTQQSGLWNDDGIYLPENGKMTFGELCALIAKDAHSQGYIASGDIQKSIDPEEADSMTGHGAVLWGTNAILSSSRARRDLGWRPSEPSLTDEIASTVRDEAERLGLNANN